MTTPSKTQEIFAADAVQLTSVPSDANLKSIAEAAKELVKAVDECTRLEAELEIAKARRKLLAHDTLPAMFDSVGTDRIGVPGSDVDVVVRDYFHANISPEVLSPEDLEIAFDHLEDLGGGDLIRTKVVTALGRGDLQLAQELQAHIQEWFGLLIQEGSLTEAPPTTIDRSIPWNTLTSFLKQWYERRDELLRQDDETEGSNHPPPTPPDLTKLNATAARVCRIEKRKNPSKRARTKSLLASLLLATTLAAATPARAATDAMCEGASMNVQRAFATGTMWSRAQPGLRLYAYVKSLTNWKLIEFQPGHMVCEVTMTDQRNETFVGMFTMDAALGQPVLTWGPPNYSGTPTP